MANVIAIFKKNSEGLPVNYRPISLTAFACKILDSTTRDDILEHLSTYKLSKESQQGFVKKRSCLTNLLKVLEYVTDYVNKDYPVKMIYLDLQNAFDYVPY